MTKFLQDLLFKGSLTLTSFVGSGTRMVVTGSDGKLAVQSLPVDTDTLASVTARGNTTTSKIYSEGADRVAFLDGPGNAIGFAYVGGNGGPYGFPLSAYMHSDGSNSLFFSTGAYKALVIAGNGNTTIAALAGTGSRMVVADANGLLSATALPTEVDTLATVTARGNITTGNIAVRGKLTIGSNDVGLGQRIEANPGDGNFDFVNSSGGGFFYRWYQNGGLAMQISPSNNLLLGLLMDEGYKLDVFGSIRVYTSGIFGSNGTITAPLIKFNGSNFVRIDDQGYGTITGSHLIVSGYTYSTGRMTSDSFFISKPGTSAVNTSFISYGIARPDATSQSIPLAGLGGVFQGTTWTDGLGLTFFVSQGADISGGNNRVEKMRLGANGDLTVTNLAGSGSRMIVASSTGLLSAQAIPTGSLQGAVDADKNTSSSLAVGTTTVKSVSATTYSGVFFDYVVKNGTNVRVGSVVAITNGTNVESYETLSNDIGSTSNLTFTVTLSGGNINLNAVAAATGWTVIVSTRAL